MVRTSNRRLVCFWENRRIKKESKDFHISQRKKIIDALYAKTKRTQRRPLCVEYSLYTKGKYKGLVKKKLKTGYV